MPLRDLFSGVLFTAMLAVAAGGWCPASAAAPAARPAAKPDSEAPLAEGWPDATQPGEIEVKDYPAYRSAMAKAGNVSLAGDRRMFFSLLEHITRSNVAMTAPVVNTYEPDMIDKPDQRGEMSTEFLYASPTLGQPGKGVGAVEVVDHPAATYVCLGLQGRVDDATLRDSVGRLREWLADHKEEWVESGPPRRLGYHGPDTPLEERLWEVQLPVKPVAAKPAGGTPEAAR
jgi:hypothetical protein